jgi:hypothetical protein
MKAQSPLQGHNMDWFKAGTLLLGAVLLTSCATKITKLEVDADKPLDGQSGYILLSVDTNNDLQRVRIAGPKTLEISEEDLTAGSRFMLVDVPAGEYDFTGVTFNAYSRSELSEGSWHFRVEPGKINYIGNLTVEVSGLLAVLGIYTEEPTVLLENKSVDALEFMQKNYPNILAARPMVYGGAGTDYFFPYVQNINAKVKP